MHFLCWNNWTGYCQIVSRSASKTREPRARITSHARKRISPSPEKIRSNSRLFLSLETSRAWLQKRNQILWWFKLKEKKYIFNTDLVTLLFFSFRYCLLPPLGAPSGLLRSPPHGSPRATADSDIPIKTAICCLKSPPSPSVRGPSTKPAGGGGALI